MAVDVTMLSGFGNNALSKAGSLEEVKQEMFAQALAEPGRRVVSGAGKNLRRTVRLGELFVFELEKLAEWKIKHLADLVNFA